MRNNCAQCTIRSVHVCALHCAQLLHTILHRTDLIIFPLTLQTITTAPMMSIWGKGGLKTVSEMWKITVWPDTLADVRQGVNVHWISFILHPLKRLLIKGIHSFASALWRQCKVMGVYRSLCGVLIYLREIARPTGGSITEPVMQCQTNGYLRSHKALPLPHFLSHWGRMQELARVAGNIPGWHTTVHPQWINHLSTKWAQHSKKSNYLYTALP